MRALRQFLLFVPLASILISMVPPVRAFAAATAEPQGNFSLQVSPSPLVATLKPGTTTELEVRIRNTGTASETLKMDTRSFDLKGEEVQLNTTTADIHNWVSFKQPTFTVGSGQTFAQKVSISVPKDAGFSYSFALLISRKSEDAQTQGNRVLRGSVAVFTLLNVDRPGAKRELDTVSFSTTKGIYEYLPADLTIKLKNTGNTIVQPYGNIFIQRGSDDTEPLATLPVNDSRGYILPGSQRSLTASWTEGFPLREKSGGTTWNWSEISHFRIGKYTAKLVAVYNDGTRDVPVQGEITFWVLPWKIILGSLVVLTLTLFGFWTLFRRSLNLVQSPKNHSRK